MGSPSPDRQALVRAFVLERKADGYPAPVEVLRDEKTLPIYGNVPFRAAVSAEIARAFIFFAERPPVPYAVLTDALMDAEDAELGATVQAASAGQMPASRILAHLVTLQLGVSDAVAASISRRLAVLLLNRDIAAASKPKRPAARPVTPPPLFKVPEKILRRPAPAEPVPAQERAPAPAAPAPGGWLPPKVTSPNRWTSVARPEGQTFSFSGSGAPWLADLVMVLELDPHLVRVSFDRMGAGGRPASPGSGDPEADGTARSHQAMRREVTGYGRILSDMKFAPPGPTLLPRGAVVELLKPSDADNDRRARSIKTRDIELVVIRWDTVSVVPATEVKTVRYEDWLAQEERGHPWLCAAKEEPVL